MLIEADQGTPIEGLIVPKQLYWVLKSPAPLAGTKLPDSSWPWSKLEAAGFVHVVSLHPSAEDPSPLSFLFKAHLEDLCHGRPPQDPDCERVLIQKSVEATVASLRSGNGVLIHCWGGRGRTGSVLGCVLRELGYDADTCVGYLDRIHKARGKPGWPESPWQADLVRTWKADA